MKGKNYFLNGIFGTLKKREVYTAYFFIFPSVILITYFWIYPSIWTIIYSFTKWDGINPPVFIGLRNFRELLFDDPLALHSLLITIYYMVGTLPEAIFLSLIIALVLNKHWLKGRQFLTGTYFLPVAISMVGVCAIWMWLLDPMSGLVNWIMEFFRLPTQAWLQDERLALLSICIVSVWKWLGWFIVIYIAALQAIPSMYCEAARIDGANRWQEFRYIIWPMLIPTTFFLLITGMIGAFQVFDQVYMMTLGGPANSTKVMMYYIYDAGFGSMQRMGYSSALATVLLIILLVSTIFQWRYYTGKLEV